MMPAKSVAFRHNRRLLLYGSVCLLVACVVGGAAYALSQLRDAAERRVLANTLTLAKSLDQTLEGHLEALQMVLEVSASQVRRTARTDYGQNKDIVDFLERQARRIDHVDFFRVTDENGDVLYGTGEVRLKPNIADRDYFIRLKNDPKAGMIISPPLVSRTVGQWAIIAAHRLERPDGSFNGVIYAALKVDDVNKLFFRVDLPPDSIIALRDSSNRLVARVKFPDSLFGPADDKGVSAHLAKALERNPSQGHYETPAALIDGIGRIYSYYRNPQFGFLVNVGVTPTVAFAALYQQAWVMAGFAGVFVFALLAAAWLIDRGWRRQDENMAALEATQRSLREAQKIANLSSYTYDLRNDRWNGSGTIRHMLGIGPDFPNDSRAWLSLIAPGYREKLQAKLREAVEQHRSFDEEYPIHVHGTGEERWLHHRAKVEIDENGQAVAMFGTVQDITERKRIEAQLQEGHDVLQSILDTTHDGVWRADSRGKLLDVNRRYCAMSGYSREELLTMHIADIEAMESPQETLEHIQRVFRTGHSQFESRHRRKDGSIWPVEISITHRNVDGGQIVAFMRDITERKRIEQELRQLATQDVLTGAVNRRHFLAVAQIEHRRAIRFQQELSVAVIDVDHFKQINDTKGHAFGDDVLKRLAEVFMRSIRDIDVFARLGGDEFVLLLPGLTAEQAVEVVERARTVLAASQTGIAKPGESMLFSVGVAAITDDDDTLDDLMSRADQALYEAKQAGRNRIRVA